MLKGVSGTVSFSAYDNTVTKVFDGTHGTEDFMRDYHNELSVLTVLDSYRDHLSFQTPKVNEYGVGTSEQGALAYIKTNRLDGTFGMDLDEQSLDLWQGFYRNVGRCVGELHSLDVSVKDQQRLTFDPKDSWLFFLNNYVMSHCHQDEILSLSERIRGMQGDKVFVHNDMKYQNLFGQHFGFEITGICDFCYSGMGVRELDFMYYTDDGVWEHFLSGYREVNHVGIDLNNLNVMRDFSALLTQMLSEYQSTYSVKVEVAPS